MFSLVGSGITLDCGLAPLVETWMVKSNLFYTLRATSGRDWRLYAFLRLLCLLAWRLADPPAFLVMEASATPIFPAASKLPTFGYGAG